MPVVQRFIRQSMLYISALLLAVSFPLTAMAESPEATVTPTTTTAPVVTQQPAPAEVTYTFNKDTQTWNSSEWVFNPTTGKYEVPVAPLATTTQVAPLAPLTTVNADGSTALDGSTKKDANAATDSKVTLDSTVNGTAASGNAGVINNSKAGNATTGDATATVINNVNSAITSGDNGKVAQFTYDVLGDVKGDIMLYPMILKTMLEKEATSGISAKQDNHIVNTLGLNATSGTAEVSNNTEGGDAKSGNANTVANVMNILNSMIAANQSFVGNINIYGSLEGDILIAPDFIPQMIANNSTQVGTVSQSSLESQNRTDIVNNIQLAAKSGSAAVFNNTTGGSATSGKADTNVVLFNLTGHEVVAENSMLVFVNVMGKWVGVIVDAPVGATSALIGNGVTQNTTVAAEADLKVNAELTNSITNNVVLTAQTGDATVANNTKGGNATTGNAYAGANIANIANSRLGMTEWFGILFINIQNDWYGSFGVNTAYGDPIITTTAAAPTGPAGNGQVGAFGFVPRVSTATATPITLIDSGQATSDQKQTAVLASSSNGSRPTSQRGITVLNDIGFDVRLPIIAGSMIAIGLSVLGLKRLFASTDIAHF